MPKPTLDSILPLQRERALIVGQTASGKSTLGAVLLDGYHERYPEDSIFIIDLKRRFIAMGDAQGSLFPQGYSARVHGRIAAVAVHARRYNRPVRLWHKRVYVVQDLRLALDLFQRLFDRGDYRNPALIFNDESLDLHRNGQVDYRMRRINQMGRERGIGQITISQRPKRIDQTFITESEKVYVGRLTRKDDRKVMADNVVMDNSNVLMTPSERYHFTMVDQVDYTKSVVGFKLNLE